MLSINVNVVGEVIYTMDASGTLLEWMVDQNGTPVPRKKRLLAPVESTLQEAGQRFAGELPFTIGITAEWCVDGTPHAEHYRIGQTGREWCGGFGNTPDGER